VRVRTGVYKDDLAQVRGCVWLRGVVRWRGTPPPPPPDLQHAIRHPTLCHVPPGTRGFEPLLLQLCAPRAAACPPNPTRAPAPRPAPIRCSRLTLLLGARR
jgi:hypothetical protein